MLIISNFLLIFDMFVGLVDIDMSGWKSLFSKKTDLIKSHISEDRL